MATADDIADPNPARTRQRLDVLEQWAEAAVATARRVTDEAGRGFSGVALIVFRLLQAARLAIALSLRLSNPWEAAAPERAKTTSAPKAAKPEASTAAAKPGRRRFREGCVSDAAILRRPLVEIVKAICDILGVTPDWSLWSDAPPPDSPTPAADRNGPRLAPPCGALPTRPAPHVASEPPPLGRRLLTRLRSSSAPDALQSALAPIAALASGCIPMPGV